MASNAVLSAQQSQVSAALTIREASEALGWTGLITNVVLLPRLGQAQLVRISVQLTNLGEAVSVDGDIEMLLNDKAFEEFDLFGQRKGLSDRQKDKRAAQGEF